MNDCDELSSCGGGFFQGVVSASRRTTGFVMDTVDRCLADTYEMFNVPALYEANLAVWSLLQDERLASGWTLLAVCRTQSAFELAWRW